MLALIFAALFTWLMHSSVAFVLFVISLTGAGLIALPLALTLVLGANVGGGLVALGLAFERRSRRGGCSTATSPSARSARSSSSSLLGPATDAIARLGADPGRLAAHFHTLFNLGLAIVFLPLTGRAAALLERLFPTPEPRPRATAAARPSRPGAARPAGAGAERRDPGDAAARRQGRADAARDDPAPSTRPTARRIREVAALEDEVDAEQEADQALPRAADAATSSTPQESAQVLEAVLFTTNLEHIGDIIDKGLLRLAAKKQKQGLQLLRGRLARHPAPSTR